MAPPITNYDEALQFLYARIDYEKVRPSSFELADFRLERMERLLDKLGNPQLKIPAVHIAGTKGKGSTACMITSILQAAGLRTGLLTSPHLEHFEERMRVQGVSPSQAQLVELVRRISVVVSELEQEFGAGRITFFELTTALAWMYFEESQAQLVVLEVGMGGRLDATNLCRPEVCVITTISRDHTHQLGNELSAIAREKGGIIKPGIPVVSGVLAESAASVIASLATQQGCPLYQIPHDFHWVQDPPTKPPRVPSRHVTIRTPHGIESSVPVPLIGEHQAHNTALAVMVIDVLRTRGWTISDAALRRGLEHVDWPARIEIVRRSPLVILDASHNWASCRALLQTLRENFGPRPRTLIFAASADKDIAGMLRQLIPWFDTVILTSYRSNPRGATPDDLTRLARLVTARPVITIPDPIAAWNWALRTATPDHLICIAGSLFLAAELRRRVIESVPSATTGESKSEAI